MSKLNKDQENYRRRFFELKEIAKCAVRASSQLELKLTRAVKTLKTLGNETCDAESPAAYSFSKRMAWTATQCLGELALKDQTPCPSEYELEI